MKHLNGNLLCAIDCETTGLDPSIHELISVAILPLNNFLDIHPKIMPFTAVMQPITPETATEEALKINGFTLDQLASQGMPQSTASELFERWFQRLNLPFRKKIVPLAHNWPFDKSFLIQWLGPVTFDTYFDYHYRDTCPVAQYLNDRANFTAEKYPFPKVNLSYLAAQLGVPHERAHTAIADALVCSKIYKKMLGSFRVTGIETDNIKAPEQKQADNAPQSSSDGARSSQGDAVLRQLFPHI